MHVHCDADLHVSRQIRDQGIWEPYESALIYQMLQPGDCFVDVGANIGYFTLLAAQRVGESGRVFAFEPELRNYRLLNENLKLNGLQGRVTAVEAGLSVRDEEARLYLHPDNLGDHQLHAAAERQRESRPVQLLSGSRYLAEQVNRVDLVKVDTQGSEYQVIEGLMPLLQASIPDLRIVIELTPYSLRAAGSSGARLISLLETLGLPMSIIDHVEHELAPCSAQELRSWCDNVDAHPEDEGFMNILVGRP
jgi:FkbM family methyltransferase